jgi:lipoate---protein ligase
MTVAATAAGRDGRAWEVTTWSGPAEGLHGLELPTDGRRHVWVLEPSRPALVLGSTQPDDQVDAPALASLGIDLVRRRSGGGAVLLTPGRSVWIDVVLPRDDPLWDDDVGRSFAWLGRSWRHALAGLGIAADVHAGPLARRRWGRLVCFAGLGPGELVVEGRKVIGLSQRRSRDVARFQCVVEIGAGDPTLATETLDLLVGPVEAGARAELAAHLRRDTGAVAVTRPQLLAGFVNALREI